MMDFDEAFERLRDHEGGFSADPQDRGNWTSGTKGKGALKGTKFGISAAAYPEEDIEGLTLERAKALYLRDYWGPAGCDAVPEQLKFDLLDFAVNSGVRTAVRCLQRAAGMPPEEQDGRLGPRTLMAVQSMPIARLVARFNGSRLLHMTEISTWPAYGRGWARRVATNLLEA